MVECEVSHFIWKEVCTQLKIRDFWISHPLTENLKSWFVVSPRHKKVPFYVLWGFWKYRNKILFENAAKNDDGICLRIVMAIKEFPNLLLKVKIFISF